MLTIGSQGKSGKSLSSRFILIGPQNDAIMLGNPVTLGCEADTIDARVVWTEYMTNVNGAQITDGPNIAPGHPNRDHYQVVQPTPTTFDLFISGTLPADGGRYECADIYTAGDRNYAELVLLGRFRYLPSVFRLVLRRARPLG